MKHLIGRVLDTPEHVHRMGPGPARDQERDAERQAISRAECIGDTQVEQIYVVDYFRLLLGPNRLLHIADKMAMRKLMPVAERYLPGTLSQERITRLSAAGLYTRFA